MSCNGLRANGKNDKISWKAIYSNKEKKKLEKHRKKRNKKSRNQNGIEMHTIW